MKLSELKSVVKEAVKEAIQEEMKDILLEAVRSPQPVISTAPALQNRRIKRQISNASLQ